MMLRSDCIETWNGLVLNGTKVGILQFNCFQQLTLSGPNIGGPYGPYKQVRQHHLSL